MTWREALLMLQVMAEEKIGAPMRRDAAIERAREDAAFSETANGMRSQ